MPSKTAACKCKSVRLTKPCCDNFLEQNSFSGMGYLYDVWHFRHDR